MVEQKVAKFSSQVSLRYASFETRLVAFVLDLIVLFSVFALFFAVAFFQVLLRTDFGEKDTPDSAAWTAAIILSAYLIFLPLYFIGLWAWRGQTVGQMAMAIKVVGRDGRPIRLARAAVRAGGLNFLPLMFVVSLVALLAAGISEDALVTLIWVLAIVGLVLLAIQVLGCLMIPFDRQRRALHDRLADTLVVEPR
ncbi:MAG: RDD family protein [Dehalococcoidia bacterium]|nr:RDD family protein [Dehalococcoidia bacterium]